jgi:hypothetical protein
MTVSVELCDAPEVRDWSSSMGVELGLGAASR